MINSIWFGYALVLIHHLILFARILFRTLASIFVNVMCVEFPLLYCLSKNLVLELC